MNEDDLLVEQFEVSLISSAKAVLLYLLFRRRTCLGLVVVAKLDDSFDHLEGHSLSEVIVLGDQALAEVLCPMRTPDIITLRKEETALR